ncbi:MAG: hypothetical protein JXX28_01995 [Deltaproteobacteria bacterium]|nr:hypothetical protein [Deltaproteobacteria bacterium]
MILWWLGLALAQEPAAASPDEDPSTATEPDTASDDDAPYEVTVYGQHLVDLARQEVLRDLKAQGYTDRFEEDGYVLMRHPEPWKGQVYVYDDGWVRMRRQRPRIEARETSIAARGSLLAYGNCLIHPIRCMRVGGWVVSRARFQAQKGRVLRDIEEDSAVYGDRVADLAVEQSVAALPARLEALWEQGDPLRGDGPPLATYAARRAALLEGWDQLTCTPWGDAMRQGMEGFLIAEVQTSDHPVTAAELDRLNRGRSCPRPLELPTRW